MQCRCGRQIQRQRQRAGIGRILPVPGGSSEVTAKLIVPAGSTPKLSAGETFCPLQLSRTCAGANGLPLLTFVDDTVNSVDAGVAAAANAAPKNRRAHTSPAT